MIGLMKVIYEKNHMLGLDDKEHVVLLPKCPKCEGVPTYNLNPCPYCGQELEYPKEQEE